MAAAGTGKLQGRTATAGTARVLQPHLPLAVPATVFPASTRALSKPAAAPLPSGKHTPVHPIPQHILDGISAVNAQWAQAAIGQPLKEPNINAQVILLGVTPFAPLQQQAVQAVLDAGIQPQAVALDLPASASTQRIALPYPQVLQLLLDLQDGGALSEGATTAYSQLQEQFVELANDVPSHRLAKSCWFLDPFEALGYHPSLDYVLAPQQLGRTLQGFGFLPGTEYAHALQHALQNEAELVLLDAALRNQEAWVSGLVREFRLQESDLSRQLGVELQAAQQLVPEPHATWDAELSRAAATLAGAQPQTRADGGNSHGMNEDLVVAYKVCKACAAALLGPQDAATGQAVTLQARLQPLKFAHFELRALHMAGQLRELCRWRAATGVLSQPAALTSSSTAPASNSGASSQPSQTSAQSMDGPSPPQSPAPFTVLAVVGRQYIPMIRRLWNDPRSALWRGDVPHSFAPSMLEPVPRAELDPDTASGGSRPVGQKSVTLGQFMDKTKSQSGQ